MQPDKRETRRYASLWLGMANLGGRVSSSDSYANEDGSRYVPLRGHVRKVARPENADNEGDEDPSHAGSGGEPSAEP